MKHLVRAYLIPVVFLVMGAIVSWHILWHVMENNCVMATDGTENSYRAWATYLGIALGAASGILFALTVSKRQLLHTLLFCITAAGVGFAILGLTQWIIDSLERYLAFVEWTKQHSVVWLDNIVYWTSCWIVEAVYCWLLPQLVTQLLAVAVTLWIVAKLAIRRQQRDATVY